MRQGNNNKQIPDLVSGVIGNLPCIDLWYEPRIEGLYVVYGMHDDLLLVLVYCMAPGMRVRSSPPERKGIHIFPLLMIRYDRSAPWRIRLSSSLV